MSFNDSDSGRYARPRPLLVATDGRQGLIMSGDGQPGAAVDAALEERTFRQLEVSSASGWAPVG